MSKIKFYIIFLCIGLNFFCAQGQNNTQKKIPLINVLDGLSKFHAVTFNYESRLLENIKVFPLAQNLSFSAKIENLEAQTRLIFTRVSNVVITITEAIIVCGYIRDAAQNPLSGATIQGKTDYVISDDAG